MIYADHLLAQRLERLEGNACARFVEARGADACWIEVAGAYAMFDFPESPITQTFGLGMFAPVTPEALDTIEEFFFSRGAPANHEVCPLAGVETVALLTQRGYRPIEFSSVLYRATADPLKGEVNPRVRVRPTIAGEHDLWASVSARGWAPEAPEGGGIRV